MKRIESFYILQYKCKVPTIFWKPRMKLSIKSSSLSSSWITNVLPRMHRLRGPYEVYGTVYGVSSKVVHIAHPVPARAILSASATCSTSGCEAQMKCPAYNHFKNFCGNGVFTADGIDWKRKRIAVQKCLLRNLKESSFKQFSSNTSHDVRISLEQIVLNQVEELVSLIELELKLKNSCTKKEIDVLPLLQQTTLSIIYQYLTHTKLKKETKKYLKAVNQIRMILITQSRSIWFFLPSFFYKYCSRMYQEEEFYLSFIRDFAKDAIDQAKPSSPLALLRDEYNYTAKDLLDETITLLFAGQDTTAATLSWALHLLSIHLKNQRLLHDEITKTFASDESSISYKSCQKIQYLDGVIKESMRLYPVAPFIIRKLTKDVQISPKFTLKKNILACIWIYGLHHQSNFFQNPQEFIPTRFFLDKENASSTATTTNNNSAANTDAFMPFALGSRNCLGQSMAWVVLKIVLCRLAQEYHFTDANLFKEERNGMNLRKDMQAGFTVLPIGATLPLLVQKRTKIN